MKASYSWIQDIVPIHEPIEQAAKRLTLAGLEVQGIGKNRAGKDDVLEVEITSNRPDWLSMIGIAREFSALYSAPCTLPDETVIAKREETTGLRVAIHDTVKCPFYSAVLLENVSWGETPAYIVERLEAVGLRSINLPVDLTNYVLYEYGQPLHVFDRDCVNGGIVVRRAQEKEVCRAINGKTYELTPHDLVIADDTSVLAIAGVMGGMSSEVHSRTKNIIVESAFFQPVSVRQTSRHHVLVSDSSYRFERRVDPRGVIAAQNRFLHLLLKHATVGKISAPVTAGSLGSESRTIHFEMGFVKRVLGIAIPREKVHSSLEGLGLRVTITNEQCTIVVPSSRADLERPIDIVEEIARIYGYDHITESTPRVPMRVQMRDRFLEAEHTVREALVGAGAYEWITFSLVNPQPYESIAPELLTRAVRIINPQNKELSLMRPSLITGMLEAVQTNIAHGNKSFCAFEMGRVYCQEKKEELPYEEKTVALIGTGDAFSNWCDHARALSFYDMKGLVTLVLESLGVPQSFFRPCSSPWYTEAIECVVGSTAIGTLGRLSNAVLALYDIKQPVFYAEVSLQVLIPLLTHDRKFQPYSKFPASYRDIAVVVPESVPAELLMTTMRECGKGVLTDVHVFDHYTGKQIAPGHRSIAFSMAFQSDERTLSSQEVDSLYADIVEAVRSKHKATLRS